jgi:glycosyltransferase involved in cell wall biosynthesis
LALFLGRLHREKGVDLVVDALKHWSGTLVVVGEGPEKNRLKKSVRCSGLMDRVIFLGWGGRAFVAAALGAADIVVVPSRRHEAGLPLVILEALAAGVPVVTTQRIATGPDDDLPNGVVTSALDPIALADAMRSVSEVHRPTSIQLPERFHLKSVAARYLALFRQLD